MQKNGSKIGRVINRLRKRKRLSRVELAEMVGCTRQYVTGLEVGHKTNPSWRIVQALASALGCDVEELK